MTSALDMPKVKWKPRRASLPQTLLCNTTEAIDLLRRDLFEAAVAAGWLHARCEKQCLKENTKLYAVEDVQNVARRVLAGEYPQPVEPSMRRGARSKA